MAAFESKSEAYKRVVDHDLETARYIRDLITKTDDTRALWKLVKSICQAAEARVLGDMGEGRKPSGQEFVEKDFWLHVGEVRGIRSIPGSIQRMMEKADAADEEAAAKEAL